MSAASYPRILIGYGPDPPDPKWPGRARLTLQFVLAYESGRESNILHGDAGSENMLTDVAGFPAGHEVVCNGFRWINYQDVDERIKREHIRPSRAAGLERFLDHVLASEDVWICRGIDIARHWIDQFPYRGDAT